MWRNKKLKPYFALWKFLQVSRLNRTVLARGSLLPHSKKTFLFFNAGRNFSTCANRVDFTSFNKGEENLCLKTIILYFFQDVDIVTGMFIQRMSVLIWSRCFLAMFPSCCVLLHESCGSKTFFTGPHFWNENFLTPH